MGFRYSQLNSYFLYCAECFYLPGQEEVGGHGQLFLHIPLGYDLMVGVYFSKSLANCEGFQKGHYTCLQIIQLLLLWP